MSTACSNAYPGAGALYLHMPFCVRRCRYCDFSTCATAADDPLVGAYVDALVLLVGRLSEAGLLGNVRTGYIGGGTPTLAGRKLCDLVAAVRAACPGLVEFSSEANPDSLDAGLARALRASGLTRLSLGVQSLDDRELAALGRVHDARRALDAARAAIDAGLDLSCDLMCGIPYQTPASWERSLAGVLASGAGHVSCYPLILEEGTPLWDVVEAGELPAPDDDAEADYMLAAERVLSGAGFSRYEVASYSVPGASCLHNAAYWTGMPYLGLGHAASSMLDAQGLLRFSDVVPLSCLDACHPEAAAVSPARYLELHENAARLRVRVLDDARSFVSAVKRSLPFNVEVEAFDARQAVCEDLMLGLRMSCGVGPELLERALACGVARDELDACVAGVVGRGLARFDAAGRLVPTQRGWLLGNELYGAFWDLA